MASETHLVTRFLDPKNDLAFKRIFGIERNKDILIHFLNDIFGRTTNPIESVTFLKTDQDPEIAAHRSSLLDVMCTDTQGNRFIIEIQVASEAGFAKRAQYYAAKAYISQRNKKVDYKDLQSVTFLGIMGFNLFPEKETYLSHHVILDKATLEHDLKDFSFSFLELPKFTKTKQQLVTVIERWAYFFKHAKKTQAADMALVVGSDVIIQRAYAELNEFNWSEEDLRIYNSIEMKQSADRSVLQTAFAEGKQAGIIEGKQAGLLEGEQAGIRKGEHTGREAEREAMARSLYALGVDIHIIHTVTSISKETLDELFQKS